MFTGHSSTRRCWGWMFEALSMAFLKFEMRMVGPRGQDYLSLGMLAVELVWVGSWATDMQRSDY